MYTFTAIINTGRCGACDTTTEKRRSHGIDELADTTVKMASFGLSRDGSFYAVDYDRGEIFQLDRQPPAAPLPPFPRKLSETGLFTSVAEHKVAPGVIPYEINAPFWSDGAVKERFFAIPNDGKITFDDSKAWEFEDGAVTVKSFSLDMEAGRPSIAQANRNAHRR